MKRLALLFLSILVAGAVTSCKKKITDEQILTDGTWRGDKVEIYNSNGDKITEYDFDYAELTFDSDHTYVYKEDGDVVDTGTWSYDSDSKILTFKSDDSHEEDEVKVITLTESALDFEYRDESMDGKFVYKFVR